MRVEGFFVLAVSRASRRVLQRRGRKTARDVRAHPETHIRNAVPRRLQGRAAGAMRGRVGRGEWGTGVAVAVGRVHGRAERGAGSRPAPASRGGSGLDATARGGPASLVGAIVVAAAGYRCS